MEGSVNNNGLDYMVSYETYHFQERESRCTRYFLQGTTKCLGMADT